MTGLVPRSGVASAKCDQLDKFGSEGEGLVQRGGHGFRYVQACSLFCAASSLSCPSVQLTHYFAAAEMNVLPHLASSTTTLPSGKGSTSARRSIAACRSCHRRKTKCDVVTRGRPCSACVTDDRSVNDCVVVPSRRYASTQRVNG